MAFFHWRKYMDDTIIKINELLFINKKEDELRKYDLVIVCGNDYFDETVSSIVLLTQKGIIAPQADVILSGNKRGFTKDLVYTEAEELEQRLSKFSLPLHYILEKDALNIKENLALSLNYIDIHHYQCILIIGKAFASRRIWMTAKKLGYPMEKVDIYGTYTFIREEDWFLNEDATKRILEELKRISDYTLKGDLAL